MISFFTFLNCIFSLALAIGHFSCGKFVSHVIGFFFSSLMGGSPLNDSLVIGGTVLEVLVPVSPCHSLVQNFMDSVCNIF